MFELIIEIKGLYLETKAKVMKIRMGDLTGETSLAMVKTISVA